MPDRSTSPSTRPLTLVLCVVMLLGAGLRVQRYLLRAPFWRDEAFIVIDVRDQTPRQLFGPLKYDQAAPPGFLLLLHAMAVTFGDGELSMRAIPLISGIAAMGIVAMLAWRLLGLPAAIFAGGLMAFCQNLIEYCAEVKQYSGDACAAAILLFVALGWAGSPLRRLWRSAIAAAILVWFSHPSAMVFAGISAVLSIEALRSSFSRRASPAVSDRERPNQTNTTAGKAHRLNGKTARTILGIAAANALFAASFLLLYHYSIRREHTNFLYSFWGDSFPDWKHPRTLVPWFFRQTSQWLNEPYHGAGYVLVALAVLAAPMLAAKHRLEVWAIAAAPLGITLLAACARQYPFGGSRLTLFTLPGFFLLAAAGGELLRRLWPTKSRLLWWLLPGSVLGYGLAWGILRAASPHYRSYLRPAIAYLQQHRRPDEPIYCLGEPELNQPKSIFAGRHVEILCYWPAVPGKVETVTRSFDEIREDRFWALIPFDTQDGQPALHKALKLLEPFASPVEKFEFVDPRGGAAILYRRKD